MKKTLLATALAGVLAWAGVASAAPLHPALIAPFPKAGEGNMPIGVPGCLGLVPACVQHDGVGGGPRVDWIVEPFAPGALTKTPFDDFLFKYQVESTSGAPTGDTRGDISRFTLSQPHSASGFMGFSAMGIMLSKDLDGPVAGELRGKTIPTGGTVTVDTNNDHSVSAAEFAALDKFGDISEGGHSGTDNGGAFANLNPLGGAPPAAQRGVPCFGDAVSCGGGGDKEVDRDGGALACCDNPVRFEASSDGRVLSWDFDPKLLHAGAGAINGRESTVLWALGANPVYGGGAALDGAPLSPWSTEHPGGLDIPVAAPIPEPASLLLLGSGLAGLGFWARRRQA